MPKFFERVGAALRGSPLENPAVPLSSPAAWLFDLFGGAPTSAGISVNEHTAMQLTSVYACINVLASAFSSLPCELLEVKQNNSKAPAYDNDLYDLLAVQPNPEMPADVFWNAMMACVALLGNAYALIQWNASKTQPIALWPIHPRYVVLQRKNNQLVYNVTIDGVTTEYKPKDLLHVRGLSLDGYRGIDPITAARQSIGAGIAAGKHIGGFFGRGSRPSGILKRAIQQAPVGTLAGKTDPAQLDTVRESWERANSGDSQGRTAVLPAGWDWQAVSVTNEQAQFLQIMQYTRTEIAGLWQIPPHMIGDTSRLSNANGQSEALNFLSFTLRPWIVRFESELQCKLLPKRGRNSGRFNIRFDTSEFLRLDFASLIQAVAMGRQWGLYNANEGRQKLGDNPIEGVAGTQYLVPLNMVTAEQLAAQPISTEPGANDVDPNEETDTDDVPAGNGGMNQRSKLLLDRIARAYAPLFRDAAGRLIARDKRDVAAISQTFGAVLQAIGDEAVRQARSLNRLEGDIDLGEEKVLRDAARAIEKRSAAWTPATVDTDAAQELARTVRSITLNIFREAAVVPFAKAA